MGGVAGPLEQAIQGGVRRQGSLHTSCTHAFELVGAIDELGS